MVRHSRGNRRRRDRERRAGGAHRAGRGRGGQFPGTFSGIIPDDLFDEVSGVNLTIFN